MQKKVLLSLLLTVPTAQMALADIALNSLDDLEKWNSNGITTGEGGFNVNNDEKTVTCGLANGVVSQTVTELPKGTYKLTFANTQNVKVSIGATELELKDNVCTFEAEGTVTINISGINPAEGFMFQGAYLSFALDFKAEAGKLRQLLVSEPYEAPEEGVVGYDALKAEFDALEKEKGEIWTNWIYVIAQQDITDTTKAISVAKLIELYNKLGVPEFQPTVDVINAFLEKVKAYKEKSKSASDNKTNYETLIDEITNAETGLLPSIDKLIKEIEASPEYTQNLDLQPAKDIKTAIEAYKAQIKAAFKDATDTVEFESQAEAFEEQIAGCQAQFDSDLADWNAYTTLQETIKTLGNDVLAAQSTFAEYNCPEDFLKTYNGVYGDVQSEWVTTVKKALADAQAAFEKNQIDENHIKDLCKNQVKNGKEVPNTSRNYIVTEALKAANATLTETLETAETLVNGQNDALVGATEVINNYQADVTKYEGMFVPAADKDDYTKYLAQAKEALEDLKAYVDTEYRAHTLDLTKVGYTELTGSFDEAKTVLDNMFTAYAPVNDLINQLEQARKDIEAQQEGYNEDVNLDEIIDVPAKMTETYDNILNAINSLDPTSDTYDQDLENIKNSIKNLAPTAGELFDAFVGTYGEFQAFDAELAKYKDYVENTKIVVLESVTPEKKLELSKYAEMKKAVDGFVAGLKAAAALDGQDVLTAAKKVEKDYTTYLADYKIGEAAVGATTWKELLKAQNLAFGKAVTEANETAVEKYIADLKTAAEEADVTIDITKLESDFTAIQGAIDAAAEWLDYAQQDAKMKQLVKELDNFYTSLDHYNTINEQIEEIQALIVQLNKDNNANSVGAGLTYFQNIIQNYLDMLDSLTDDVKAMVKNGKLDDKNFEMINDSLLPLGFKGDLNELAQAILDNNTYYQQQLAKSATVHETLEGYIAQLEGLENPLPEAQEWLKTLKDLQGIDLIDNDRDVTEAYGKGESKAQNTPIMDEYQRILDAALKVMTDFGGYDKAVVDANNAVVAESGWDQIQKDLYNQYILSVGEYNDYLYTLKNEAYRNAILNGYNGLPGVGDHRELYDKVEEINALIQAASKFVEDANKAKEVLTADKFKTEVLDKATTLSEEMKTIVDTINADAEAIAIAYYGDILVRTTGAISDAGTSMEAAGVTEKIRNNEGGLKAAYDNLVKGSNLYLQGANDATAKIALVTDQVATLLDAAMADINVQAGCEAQWTASYSAAETTISEKTTELEGYSSIEGYEDVKAAFDAIVEDIKALDAAEKAFLAEQAAKPAEERTALVDVLKPDYLDPLANLLTQLNTTVANAKTAYDNLVANDKLTADLTALVADYNQYYSDLEAYINAFTSADASGVPAVKAAIDDFDQFVKDNAGKLTTLTSTINSKKASVKAAFIAAYNAACVTENNDIQSWQPKLKVAYNEAAKFEAENGYQNFSREELDAMQQVIDNYWIEAGKLLSKYQLKPNGKPEANQKIAEDYQKASLALLAEVTTMYQKLQKVWTSDPVVPIVAGLTEAYDNVAKAIADGQTALASDLDNVQEEFEGQYEALQNALDAIKAAWESETDNALVLASYEKYENQMQDILDEVDALTEEIAARQAYCAASNAVYDTLKAQYDELAASFEALKNTVESLGLTELVQENALDYINSLLEGALADLDEHKAAFDLTKDSKLLNAEEITSYISMVNYEAYHFTALNKAEETKAALAAVSAELSAPGSNFINGKELRDAYDELFKRFTDVVLPATDYEDATAEDLKKVQDAIAEYEAIKAAADELLENAKENQYVLGDVTLDPDGTVNIFDVQIIVGWIGEGLTYDELLAENPRKAYAADVTGDHKINIADATAILNLALGESAGQVRVNRAAAAPAQGADHYSIAYMGEVDGADRYALVLNNTNALVAGQFDIKLPAGMNLVAVTAAERAENHVVAVFDKSASEARVVMYSAENAEIAGNGGAIVFIDVQGAGSNITVENMIFADRAAREYVIDQSGTTGIMDSLIEGAKDAKEAIYDAAGRVYDRVHRGLNIIRKSDGSVSKEIRK